VNIFHEPLPPLRWQDGVDILIMAFVFYNLILLLRGTRAIRMLAGLGLLLAVSFGANRIGLHAVSWVLQNLLGALVLVVIILFQPELRRALANMGRAPLLRFLDPIKEERVLQECVRGTAALAAKRIGALIALQGTEALRALAMPPPVTIVGIVLLTAAIDFLVPSASAKWALLAPILVPMLMGAGIAPEFTQAAFRVGDGPVNLVTPLMPYFPLVLSFCRRYVTGFGVGTLMSLLLPFGVAYMVLQIAMLLLWWLVGLPLGVGGRYVFP